MLFNLSESASIASHFLSEIRDISTQKDRLRFRRNLERLGEILAYELSKELDYSPSHVKTVLGEASFDELREFPVIMTVLRAGLPLYQGVLNYFDKADSGFLGAYRAHKGSETEFEIRTDYLACPNLDGRALILADPMLATGRSLVDGMNMILKNGTPKFVHVVSVIATPEGIRHLNENFPVPFKIWTAAVDTGLNAKSYIVPGLGDAGDLSFGDKL